LRAREKKPERREKRDLSVETVLESKRRKSSAS